MAIDKLQRADQNLYDEILKIKSKFICNTSDKHISLQDIMF